MTNEVFSELGLRSGQIRADDLVHNGGWYNSDGEKLGWGDLSAEDLRRLRDGLPADELFIVLGESDSFWNFVTHNPGITGDFCKTTVEEMHPGRAYMAKNARYVIETGVIWRVESQHFKKREHGEEFNLLGYRAGILMVKSMSRSILAERLGVEFSDD
jgi:hypothetical protein